MPSIRNQFKDATIIFIVVHYEFECVRLSLLNILSIINSLDDTYLILINSNATQDIQDFLDKIQSKKVDRVNLPINFGFNHSVKLLYKRFYFQRKLPKSCYKNGC